MSLAGLSLTPPPDFVVDQTMITWRAPAPTQGDPRFLHKQAAIRPNLIIHRREVGANVPLEVLAGEVTAELVSSVPGLGALTSESFTFADGTLGIIIGFDFSAATLGSARQYHVLRKDGGVFTTMTLTLDKLTLNDAARARWMTFFASAAVNGNGALS